MHFLMSKIPESFAGITIRICFSLSKYVDIRAINYIVCEYAYGILPKLELFLVRNKGQINLVKLIKHCFVSSNNPTTFSPPITFYFFSALLQELHIKLVISLTTYCSAGDGQY